MEPSMARLLEDRGERKEIQPEILTGASVYMALNIILRILSFFLSERRKC